MKRQFWELFEKNKNIYFFKNKKTLENIYLEQNEISEFLTNKFNTITIDNNFYELNKNDIVIKKILNTN